VHQTYALNQSGTLMITLRPN